MSEEHTRDRIEADPSPEEVARVMNTLAASESTDDPSQAHLRARVGAALFGLPAPPPPLLGRYRLLHRVGAGAMGEVVAAFDDVLERRVAIKLVHRRRRGPRATARLIQEAKSLARLSHPHVVQVYEAGVTDDRAWIAMEFVEGCTLSAWLAARPWPTAEILRVFVEAGRGLSAAHRAGLVHRDFKPDNVLIDGQGRARVADFGLVRFFHDSVAEDSAPRVAATATTDRSLTQDGTLLGTPAYMAPEQLAGSPTDARGDQFSFCVAAWEALFGVRPFAGNTPTALAIAIATGRPRRTRVRPVSRRVLVALTRGLAPEPQGRFADMDLLLAELTPAPARGRMLAVGALAGVVAVLGLRHVASAPDTCAHAGDIDTIWSPDRAERVTEAFGRSGLPYAPSTASRVREEIDGFSRAWKVQSLALCSVPTSSASAAQVACLERGRVALQATVTAFEHADAETVEHAMDAVAQLPAIERCQGDLARPPPTDPALADALASARVLAVTGHAATALGLAAIAQDAAHRAGDAWSEVEARSVLARTRLELGELDTAVLDLRAAAELATAQGLDGRATAMWIELASAAATHLRDRDRAREWLGQAEAWSARLGSDPTAGRLALARAHVLAIDDPAAARDAFAALVRESTAPERAELRQAAREAKAAAAFSAGRFAEAALDYQDVLEGSRTRMGPFHPRTATAAYNLGIALDRMGERARAMENYQLALEVWSALHPQHDDGVALVHIALAQGELAEDHLEAAREHARAALAMQTRTRSAGDVALAEAWTVTGVVHHAAGEFADARQAHARARRIYEDALGPDHAMTAIATSNEAEAMVMLGEIEPAGRDFAASLRALESAFGSDHPYLAYPLKGLGMVALLGGDPATARTHLERAQQLAGDHDALERAEIDLALGFALVALDSTSEIGRRLAATAAPSQSGASGAARLARVTERLAGASARHR